MAISGFVKKIRDIMRLDAGINGDAQRIEQLVWILFLKVYDAKEENWEFDDDNYESIIPEECRWRNWAGDSSLTGDKLLDFVNNTLFPTLKELPVTADTPMKKAIVKTTFEDANNYMKGGVYLRQVIDVVNEIDLEDTSETHAFGDIYESILKELQSAGSSGEFYTPRAVTEFMAEMIEPKIGETMADFACGTGGFLTSWIKQLENQKSNTGDIEKINTSFYGMEKKPFPYLLCITNLLLHGMENPNVTHGNSLTKNLLDYTEKDQFDKILMNPPYGGHENASVKGYFPDDLASSETADLFMSVIMYRLKKNGRAAVILPDGFLFGNDNAKTSIKEKLIKDFNLHTIIRMPGSVFAPYTSITTNILFFDNTTPTDDVWFYRMDMPEGYKHFSKTKPMKLEHFDKVRAWWNDRQEIVIDEWPKAKKFSAKEIADNDFNLDLCGFPHEEEEILEPMELIKSYQEHRQALNAKIDKVLETITEKLNCNEGK
ncbi:MAG: class I SAM-dependent DNA methyltransferase [Selenomonadaceae bacterium]|nr:class I SAM-dependent DNA methyltransferase [Selenomonadaceae bacterium]